MTRQSLNILLLTLLMICAPVDAGAQGHVRKAMERAREKEQMMAAKKAAQENVPQGEWLRMKVENGDTMYFDKIPPVWIFGRGSRSSEKEWRKYYKLVYRFARVYPYAEASGGLRHIVDSTIAANNYNRFQREQYINKVQKDLFKDFEGALRHMTITQGALLLKLIDRETGMPPYAVIKEYKSGAAAGFWQAVAKLFENDLKSEYDPEGEDRDIEELVQIWKAGAFKNLYWSVFWEDPPEIEVPEKYFR
ncbi:MAG: DUF4294 domain-containing protein [Bacteroidales bacterium]|nr:DUF4294 domain-containing protein [Bacteroidales bacterium]